MLPHLLLFLSCWRAKKLLLSLWKNELEYLKLPFHTRFLFCTVQKNLVTLVYLRHRNRIFKARTWLANKERGTMYQLWIQTFMEFTTNITKKPIPTIELSQGTRAWHHSGPQLARMKPKRPEKWALVTLPTRKLAFPSILTEGHVSVRRLYPLQVCLLSWSVLGLCIFQYLNSSRQPKTDSLGPVWNL